MNSSKPVAAARRVPVIGLVGGVGSGKSTVARIVSAGRPGLSEPQHPILTIPGDEAGHQALARPDIQSRIRSRFGDDVFHPDGSVNRAALGRIVFGPSDAQTQARHDLESIVHPAIVEEFQNRIALGRTRPETRAILLDAAVLLESGWRVLCDAVAFVDVPEAERFRRVATGRGWDEAEFRRREQSQWPVGRKRGAADFVIDNSGDPEIAADQLRAVIERAIASDRPVPVPEIPTVNLTSSV